MRTYHGGQLLTHATIVVSSIENLRNGENQQCPQFDSLILAKESNQDEEEDLLLTVADKTNIELNRPTARPTTPITQVYIRKLQLTPQKPRNLYIEWATDGDNTILVQL